MGRWRPIGEALANQRVVMGAKLLLRQRSSEGARQHIVAHYGHVLPNLRGAEPEWVLFADEAGGFSVDLLWPTEWMFVEEAGE